MPEGTKNEGGRMRSPGRVLLVLDRPVLAEVVKLALNHAAFVTSTARDVAAAAEVHAHIRPHLAVVDMDMAQGAVLDLLGYTAPSAERTPVVALTRRGDLKTKLAAFERGVDDILTIPFSPEELVARVLAVMRRSYRTAIPFTPTIQLGELEIDMLNRHVRVGARELHLTAAEQSLLYLLAANAGQLLSREEILDALWGEDYLADSNVVDRHIRNLRIKLQNGWRRPRYIATVRGAGYRFLPTATGAGGPGPDEETS
ncbi:MAG TPA: response regulator transcription factor [Chloroflexota bacterium]|jgi:DNA-binding response OmpR family regulator